MARVTARHAFGVALVLVAACSGRGTPAHMPAGDALSPDPYRPQIVAIDRVVFQPGPMDAAAQDDLTASINQLADRIDSARPSALAQILSRNLRRLGQSPPSNVNLLQREWVRIRSSLFTDAAWFRRSSADPVAALHAEEAVNPQLPPPAGGTDGKQLERALHDLVTLVFNVRHSPRDTSDAPRWTAKLDAIANEMPDAPATDADPKYMGAYQRTTDAIQLARQMRLDESYAYMDTAFKILK